MTPNVQAQMTPAYEAASNEKGQGSYNRMKAGMESFVTNNKKDMFAHAANLLLEGVYGLLQNVLLKMDQSKYTCLWFIM